MVAITNRKPNDYGYIWATESWELTEVIGRQADWREDAFEHQRFRAFLCVSAEPLLFSNRTKTCRRLRLSGECGPEMQETAEKPNLHKSRTDIISYGRRQKRNTRNKEIQFILDTFFSTSFRFGCRQSASSPRQAMRADTMGRIIYIYFLFISFLLILHNNTLFCRNR